MSNINLITTPDKLYNESPNLFLIYPSNELKDKINDFLLSKEDLNLNIYIYEEQSLDPKWLLDIVKFSDIVIYEIDNADPLTRCLDGYLLAKNKTYWLTNSDNPYYTILSNKRLFDYEQVSSLLGGYFETQQETE